MEQLKTHFNVTSDDIERLQQILKEPNISLNEPIKLNGDDGGDSLTREDLLETETLNPEDELIVKSVSSFRNEIVKDAISQLSPRERRIIMGQMTDDYEEETLQQMSVELGISRERVRQIRVVAIEKLKRIISSKVPKSQRNQLFS